MDARCTDWRVDLRLLGPGGRGRIHREVGAPTDWRAWGTEVPPGTAVSFELAIAPVSEGVQISGQASVPIRSECSRCLDPITDVIVVEVEQDYVGGAQAGLHERAETAEPVIEADSIDLEPALRDAVLSGLPLRVLCRADCPGLCPQCGVRLAEHPGHGHELIDPRWAALAGLVEASPDTSRKDD